jgi:hypothetical protein
LTDAVLFTVEYHDLERRLFATLRAQRVDQ